MNMNRTSVGPARMVVRLLAVLVTWSLPCAALGQAPRPGGIPLPAPVVPTLPTGAGEVGLTIILLMLAAIAAAGVWAELSRMKAERESRRARPIIPTPTDSPAGASAGTPSPRRTGAGVPQPRHSH